jgi:hypothetical protein
MAIRDAIPFGISGDAAAMTATESISITHRADKAEVVGSDGNYFACSYYNQGGDWSTSGYSNAVDGAVGIGLALSAANVGKDTDTSTMSPGFTGPAGATGGEATGAGVYVTEITREESNEDFVKYSYKGQFWDIIE